MGQFSLNDALDAAKIKNDDLTIQLGTVLESEKQCEQRHPNNATETVVTSITQATSAIESNDSSSQATNTTALEQISYSDWSKLIDRFKLGK